MQGSTVLKHTGLLKVHCLISIQARQVSRDNRDTQQRSCNMCQSNMSLEQATGRSIGSLNLMVTKAFSHVFHSYPFSTSPSISQKPVLICMDCTLAHKRT